MRHDNSIKISLIYLATGLIWITLSDTLVNLLLVTEQQKHVYQTIKGFIYVGSTALLLYLLLKNYNNALLKKLRQLLFKERKLQESEARYLLLFRESPLANIIYDLATLRILEVNDQAVLTYGYDREELLNMTVTDVLHDYNHELIQKGNTDYLDSGIHLHQKRDSSFLNIEMSAHRLKLNGTPCVMIVCNDVTQRENAVEQLKENQRRLLSAQRIARIGYWRFSTDKNELYWTEEVYEIWGVQKDSFNLSFDSFFESIHPDDKVYFTEERLALYLEQNDFDVEHRIILPGGAIKWVHEIGKILRNVDGLPIAIEGTVQDITTQKILSLSLEESLKKFGHVAKATSDAIWDWNLEDNTLVWGEGFRTTFGYSIDSPETNVDTWADHIAQEDKERVISGIYDIINGSGINWKDEYKYLKADGSYLFVADKGFVIRDSNGKAVRMVGAMEDVTDKKKEALQKELIATVSAIFNEPYSLQEALKKTLSVLITFGDFDIAEAWLIGKEKKRINLIGQYARDESLNVFFEKSLENKSFAKGDGLPGYCWQTAMPHHWRDAGHNDKFLRKEAALLIGLKSVFGIPLKHNNEVIGVLVLGSLKNIDDNNIFSTIYEGFYLHLSSEIRRKQVEEELNHIFNFAPDIICIEGTDGFYKKVNPAMCKILGYTEEELLAKPATNFIHPEDVAKTLDEMHRMLTGEPSTYFENRHITKTGKIIWLAWTTTSPSDEGLFFSVGKDITDKKELTLLLDKATTLAKIGAWEIDLIDNQLHWSDITCDIHELPHGYTPGFDESSAFYPEGKQRDLVYKKVEEAIRFGTPWDIESQIITAKGNTKWVRSIGEAEFRNDICTRVYGSFQDIDHLKKSEIAAIEALKDKEKILESIGEAFIAVDNNWTITYWNKIAEKVLGKSRIDVLNNSLWDEYADAVGTIFEEKYRLAVTTAQPQYFEAYYTATASWYDISAYPTEKGLSIFFKDVTERKKYISAIEEQNTKLQEIAWSQSHEVRAPMARIMGLALLLKDVKPKIDNEMQEMLEMLLFSTEELDNVVRKINDKAKSIDIYNEQE